MNVIVLTYPTPKDVLALVDIKKDDVIIAVDQAIEHIDLKVIKPHVVLGDFDSIKDENILKDFKIKRLNPIKDLTDTHDAILYAQSLKPNQIYLIGGMDGGKRIEHFYAHTLLFDIEPHLIWKNEHTDIRRYDEGSYKINRDGYVSIFAYPYAKISLKGFKYPLIDYELKQFDPLCISNEVTDVEGWIDIHKGSVLVYQSKKE